jgi:hypothetical protein
MSPDECMRLLGLVGPVSVEQIKQSYRHLAQRWHPDKNSGDELARQQFMSISEAYRTLVRAARAIEQGRKVGVCAHCGQFGEVALGRDGSSLCVRCILRPGGGRLLPMPLLVIAKCVGTVLLIVVAVGLLYCALIAEDPFRVEVLSAGAALAGLLSLAALAWTCLTVIHCLSDRERNLQHSYRRAEADEKSSHRARRRGSS